MRSFALAILTATFVALANSAALAATYEAAVLADNPAGYWRFEETTGTQAFDSSGNIKHGTYTGGVTLGSSGAASIGGNAATFNGSTGYVNLPGTWGGTAAVTIEAWINVAALTGNFQAIVAGHDPNNFAHFQLFDGVGGATGPYVDGGPGFVSLTPPSANPIGQWRHIALVAESGNTRLYQNGGQLGGANAALFTNIMASSVGNVDIGRGHMGTRWFNGQIDEVAIYNSALTQAQLNSHFTAATGGLLGHYTFDVDGTDASFQANHGVLSGGATITSDARIGAGALDLRTASGAGSGFVDIVNPILQGHNQYTITAWVNADSRSGACCDALVANDAFPTGAVHVNLNGGTLENAVATTAPFSNSSDVVPTDEWVHLAVAYDATAGNTKLYINGELEADVNHTLDVLAGVGGTTIGAWDSSGAGAYSRFFDGRIDDLRIFSRVLSQEEILALAVPEPASIACWALLSLAAFGIGWRQRRKYATTST